MAGKIGHYNGYSANEFPEGQYTYDPPFYVDMDEKNLKGFSGDTYTGSGRTVHFDGSLCSAEYVSGATLQPSALETLVCIKL